MKLYEDNLILVKMPNPTIELVKTIVRENCITKDIKYVFYDYIFIGPSLLNEFIALIKETSIAGYVAVQDLTRGGDIIRSRTYDAWTPLIAVAIIYIENGIFWIFAYFFQFVII